MARIGNVTKYPKGGAINGTDSLLGTDGITRGTKVFTVEDLADFFNNTVVYNNVKVSFGDSKPSVISTMATFKNTEIFDKETGEYKKVKTYHLIIDFPDYHNHSTKVPTLLIDRYKPKEKLNKRKGYRKAGFKHSLHTEERPTEIVLTGVQTIVDIKPETYFKIVNNIPLVKGISKNKSTSLNNKSAFTKLALRLKVGDAVSNQICKLNLALSQNKNLNNNYIISYQFI